MRYTRNLWIARRSRRSRARLMFRSSAFGLMDRWRFWRSVSASASPMRLTRQPRCWHSRPARTPARSTGIVWMGRQTSRASSDPPKRSWSGSRRSRFAFLDLRLHPDRRGERRGHEAAFLALLEHAKRAVVIGAGRDDHPGTQDDFGESRDAIL